MGLLAILKACWKPLSLVAAWLMLYAIIAWYGHWRYESGRAYEKAKAEALTAAITTAMQQEKDLADAKHRGAVLARESAQRDLLAVRSRLDRMLLAHGRDPANPGTGRRPDHSGPDWIAGFATCYAEYGYLATNAARWAEQVNGLQGYIDALRRKGQ